MPVQPGDGNFSDDSLSPSHKRLLEQDSVIKESLTNLSELSGSEDFEVIALPLKIRADGALTRAVARVRE